MNVNLGQAGVDICLASNGKENVPIRFGGCTGTGRGSSHPYSYREPVLAPRIVKNEGPVHPSDLVIMDFALSPQYTIVWVTLVFTDLGRVTST